MICLSFWHVALEPVLKAFCILWALPETGAQVWSAIFFTRICEWIWLAEAITVIGQKKSQIMRELNRPTFVLIFLFCLLAVHLWGSNKMVRSCLQLCFLSLLAAQMQNKLLKQTRLCSFPSTEWFWVSNRHLLSAKYSYFSRANLRLLNTESAYTDIRKGTEGRPKILHSHTVV